jgi:hypothetical protein
VVGLTRARDLFGVRIFPEVTELDGVVTAVTGFGSFSSEVSPLGCSLVSSDIFSLSGSLGNPFTAFSAASSHTSFIAAK